MLRRVLKVKGLLIAAVVLVVGLLVYYGKYMAGQTYLWEDLLYYSYPSASYFTDAIREARFPMWICGMRDGLPFYTNLNLTAFYPPLWLLTLLAPAGRLSVSAFQCYQILQLVGAGLFAYVFLRGMRLQPVAAMLGMIVFVFSAFMSLHIIHINVITAYLWLPLQCFFVYRIAGRRFAPWDYLGLIFSTLMSFFAGFPQVLLYNSYFIAAYWLFLFFVRRKNDEGVTLRGLIGRGVIEGGIIAATFMVVALLGAMQFLPVAENWSVSARALYGYDVITDESLPWYYLIHGVVPNFFGMSGGAGGGIPFWGFDKNSLGYKNWHAGAWQYWEFGFYAGQMALMAGLVVVCNIRRMWTARRETLFFVAMLLPVLLLMLGRYGGLFDIFYRVVPGFSLFRAPARIGCLLDFCLAVNAAVVLDAMLERREALNLRKPLVLVGCIYGLMLLGFLLYGQSIFPELNNPVFWEQSLRQLAIGLLFCIGCAAAFWIIKRARSHLVKTFSAVLLTILTFVDLYLAFQFFHGSRVNPDDYYADRNGLMAQMTKMREQKGPFRFAQLRDGRLSEELIYPRNAGYLYPHYEALEGYVLFNLTGLSTFMGITNEAVRLDIQNVGVIANAERATGRVQLMQYTNALPRAKFYHDLRVYEQALLMNADLDSGRLDYHHAVGVLSEDMARVEIVPSHYPARESAEVHFTPETPEEYRISYRTTAPGIIFISESYYPGWEAEGGKYPIIRAFGAFKGIVIPEAGSGVITVKFSPRSFKIGLAISFTTLMVLMVGLVFTLRHRR